jgi:hypothetical protein
MLHAFHRLKLYVASSSRKPLIDDVLAAVRSDGHEAYDFRASGRGPMQIFDPAREVWTPEAYVEAITGPIAQAQFAADLAALEACDCVVLLTPCGNDGHAEAGWARGKNVPVLTYLRGLPPRVDAPILQRLRRDHPKPASRIDAGCPARRGDDRRPHRNRAQPVSAAVITAGVIDIKRRPAEEQKRIDDAKLLRSWRKFHRSSTRSTGV